MKDGAGGQYLVAHPQKSYVYSPLLWAKQVFVQSVGFAYLALDAVSLDSLLEKALGDRYHHVVSCLRHRHIYGTQRIGCQGRVAFAEERLQSFPAAKAFFFAQGM